MLLVGLNIEVSFAQNLVFNSDFEQYDTCPNMLNQVPFATGWQNWLLSPDYFNACAPQGSTSISVPYNCGPNNFQYAHSGNGYVGYFNYWTRAFLNGYPWAREHIGIQLNQTLQVGVKYFFTMYVSLASWVPSPCASSKIGIKLTTQSFANPNGNITPLVDNTATVHVDTLITDTLNWTKITGSFVADSAYQYLVIGNFFDDFNIDTLIIGSTFLCYSYYLVDDICLSADSSTCLTVGIQNWNHDYDLKIYPKPLQDESVLDLPESLHSYILKLYNVLGEEVKINYEIDQEKNRITIKKGNLMSGMYNLRVFYDRKIKTIKLIIN